MQEQSAYRYEFVSADVFKPIFKQHREVLFSHHHSIDADVFYSQDEIDKLDSLFHSLGRPNSLSLLVYDGDTLVGWSVGNQTESDGFYMRNSAVFPQYRRQGVYSEMMRRMIERITAMGFQRIISRHHCSNNAVIIAKLKHGFMISGIEVTDIFGTLVQLTYYPNEKRRDVFAYRVGESSLLPEAK